MLSYYELTHDDDEMTLNGLFIDQQLVATMKALGLKRFRSCAKNVDNEQLARAKDRAKAKKLYGNKVDLSEYRIHHSFNGLVGLVPKDLHTALKHNGYFWRLSFE